MANDLKTNVSAQFQLLSPHIMPQKFHKRGGIQNILVTDAPPKIQAVGHVINALLASEHHPDLSTLPPELASKIREHLLRM